jgi:Tfp pilus assembly protein FimT
MKLKNLVGGIALIAVMAVVALPMVNSHFFSANLPVTVTNNDNNSSYAVTLVAYGDTNNVLCTDTDNGVKPDSNNGGQMTWFDPTDANTYSFNEVCLDANTLLELSCSKNIKINGVQYNNYVGAFRVNCTQIGYTSCNAALRRCI